MLFSDSNRTSSTCRISNRRHSSSKIPNLQMETNTCLEEEPDDDKTNTQYQGGESKLKQTPAKTSLCKRFLRTAVRILDLSLMKDLVLVNVMFGLSFAVFAELNFTMLVPFMMADYGLNSHQIATFVSTLSIVDICLRFLSPYIGNLLKQPPRVMYMIALILLIVFRSCTYPKAFFKYYSRTMIITIAYVSLVFRSVLFRKLHVATGNSGCVGHVQRNCRGILGFSYSQLRSNGKTGYSHRVAVCPKRHLHVFGWTSFR